MATIVGQDYRRPDLRSTVLENPYWISSAPVGPSAPPQTPGLPMFPVFDKAKGQVLFDFQKVGTVYEILQVVLQVLVGFTASTTLDIGLGTVAVDPFDGTNITIGAKDTFFKTADATIGTAGYYASTTGNTSAWLTASIAGTFASPAFLKGVAPASNMPVIYSTIANGSAITAGSLVVHVLLTGVPGTSW